MVLNGYVFQSNTKMVHGIFTQCSKAIYPRIWLQAYMLGDTLFQLIGLESTRMSELYSVQEYYFNDNCMNEFNEHKAKIEEALSRVNVSIDVIGGLLGICLEH